MNCLENIDISCPYCGETITLVLDGSIEQQRYFEDCHVCCHPIDIFLNISSEGAFEVEAKSENDI